MSFRVLLSLLAALTGALAIAGPAVAAESDIKVSEFRFRGPTGGNDEFVELVNRGPTRQPIAGFRLVGCSTTGPSGVRATVPANRSIPAGGRYLFANNASGTGGQYPVAAPRDQNYATGISDNGGVQITNGSGVVLDQVGSTASTCKEGTGLTIPTANGDNSFERAFAGLQDTDDNAGDFTGPKANNATFCGNACDDTLTPGDQPPSATGTNPPNGATNVPRETNVDVSFSEPVNAGPSAFELRCGDQDVAFALSSNDAGTVFTLNPNERLPRDTQCTVTVRAAGVSDRDTDDPPDTPTSDFTSSFRTDSSVEGLRIRDIQGRQHLSPYRGAFVAAVPGVVTSLRRNGFFYQDSVPDEDPRTSEGIFVFTSAAPDAAVQPGTAITVSGQITEFRPGGSSNANLSTTEITRATTTPVGSGVVAPTIVGRGGRVPPKEIVDNDTVDPGGEDPTATSGDVEAKSSPTPADQDPTFDPGEDGIDFYESLEGMLTEVRNAVAVAPTSDFGSNREIPVVADSGADANVRGARGPITVRGFDSTAPQEYRLGDFNPERVILNDANDPTAPFLPDVDVRDRFAEPVRAVVDYSFGNFKFLVVNRPAVTDGGLQPERTRSRKAKKELAVASYNVENLDGADPQERYDRIAGQIITNLRSPDILSLEEIQDNDGAASPAPTNADVTYARLIEAIERAGGPTYDVRQIDPAPASDGGQPGGNIRVAFLFRTDRRDLSFVDRPGGTATTPTEPVAGPDGAQLTLSPGRVDPTNPVFTNSRKPLAGEFRYRGRPLFVVGNHFSSKGGDDPIFGRFQEPRRPSELQRRGSATNPADTVRGQAGVLNAFVRRLLDIDPRARVVVLGDINDFEFSETLRVLEEGDDPPGNRELVNLWRLLPQSDRYSFIFQGNAQVLDHILVSPALLFAGRPDYDAVHINAEFSDQASDHDPPITRLRLDREDDDEDDDRDREDDD